MLRFLLPVVVAGVLFGCTQTEKKTVYQAYGGFAEGTSFSVSYKSDSSYDEEIDSLLFFFEKSLSTYDSTSLISALNYNDSTAIPDEWFVTFFNKSVEVSEMTGGAFDITVAPLVNAWGFGFKNKENVTAELIDSIRQFVGIEKVRLVNGKLVKDDPRVMLDGNAIAKGYSVDVLSEFFESKEITDYMVEIGGEIRTKGVNSSGVAWRIGIDKPIDNTTTFDRELEAVAGATNTAIATSGNYRRFYIEEGVRYSHTIDPSTGYPVKHNLLSASVMASDCITADALATSFMVMGAEKSKEFITSHEGIEGFLIFGDGTDGYETWASPGFEKILQSMD